MKNLFLFIAMAAATVLANAQIVSSDSRQVTRIDEPKVEREPSGKVRFFHAGIGTNIFKGDDCDDLENNLGYQFGFQFQKPMGSIGFFRGMDFSIGTRGWKFTEENYYGDYEAKLQAWNVQWSPFLFGYAIEPTKWLSIRPQMGIYLSVDFGGNFKFDDDGESDDYSIWDYEGVEDDDYFPLDAGLHWGADIVFNKRVVLGVTFQKGFICYDPELDGSAFNFLARVGIVVGR